jgi:hypothetical protein
MHIAVYHPRPLSKSESPHILCASVNVASSIIRLCPLSRREVKTRDQAAGSKHGAKTRG